MNGSKNCGRSPGAGPEYAAHQLGLRPVRTRLVGTADILYSRQRCITRVHSVPRAKLAQQLRRAAPEGYGMDVLRYVAALPR